MGRCVRATFELDADLIGEVQGLTGMTDGSALIHDGLRVLTRWAVASRRARLPPARSSS
jgi:hypothetical protein